MYFYASNGLQTILMAYKQILHRDKYIVKLIDTQLNECNQIHSKTDWNWFNWPLFEPSRAEDFMCSIKKFIELSWSNISIRAYKNDIFLFGYNKRKFKWVIHMESLYKIPEMFDNGFFYLFHQFSKAVLRRVANILCKNRFNGNLTYRSI